MFAESSMYGLPIFTYNTGGIGSYVVDGKNGYKLPLESTPDDFADLIFKIIKNKKLYEQLSALCPVKYTV